MTRRSDPTLPDALLRLAVGGLTKPTGAMLARVAGELLRARRAVARVVLARRDEERLLLQVALAAEAEAGDVDAPYALRPVDWTTVGDELAAASDAYDEALVGLDALVTDDSLESLASGVADPVVVPAGRA